jgi:hypothetical protein
MERIEFKEGKYLVGLVVESKTHNFFGTFPKFIWKGVGQIYEKSEEIKYPFNFSLRTSLDTDSFSRAFLGGDHEKDASRQDYIFDKIYSDVRKQIENGKIIADIVVS